MQIATKKQSKKKKKNEKGKKGSSLFVFKK